MAEETTDPSNTNLPDLNAVLTEQQETIKLLSDQLKDGSSQTTPIFNTSPSAPQKPPNILMFLLIGAIVFLVFKGKVFK